MIALAARRSRAPAAGRVPALVPAALLALALSAGPAAGAEDREVSRPAAAEPRELSGAELFEACAGCHSLAPGAPHGNGPNLWGIAGQRAATREGFAYSEALSASAFTWNRGTLTAWVLATDVVLPGTWMVYHNTLAADEVGRLVNYILDASAP